MLRKIRGLRERTRTGMLRRAREGWNDAQHASGEAWLMSNNSRYRWIAHWEGSLD